MMREESIDMLVFNFGELLFLSYDEQDECWWRTFPESCLIHWSAFPESCMCLWELVPDWFMGALMQRSDWPEPILNETQRLAAGAPIWIGIVFDSSRFQLFKCHAYYLFSLHIFMYYAFMCFYFFPSLHKFITHWLIIQIMWEFLHHAPYCF